MAAGDKYPVVYVDGDVPQRPIQLGQLLVDSSQIDATTTNLQQCTSQSPLIYVPVAGAFGRTAAEVLAGVTPTNYYYPEGRVDRYGNNTVPGTTDMRAAFDTAYLVFKNGGAAPWGVGTYRLNKNGATSALAWNSHVTLNGFGAMTLVGSSAVYTLLDITGGSNVEVNIDGVVFDGARVGYTPAADDSVGLKFGSSLSRVDVARCHFKRFSGDAVYSNSTVNGTACILRDTTMDDIGRSAVTITVGEKWTLSKLTAKDIQVQPFSLQAASSGSVLRNIDVVDSHVIGGGNYSVAPYHNIDRAGFAVIGQPGAAATDQCNIRVRGGSVRNFGLTAAISVPLVLGVETRDLVRPTVSGLLVDTVRNIGLYSYRTDGAVYEGNVATGCDIGLGMNDCDNYSDIGNTCLGNTTSQKSYFGVDGATSYIRADGLNDTLARGTVTFPAGVPTLAGGAFNVAVQTDLGTGNTRFVFTRNANTNARYSVEVTPGNSSATVTYRVASQTSSTFTIETFAAGVAADEPYSFVVTGMYTGTVEP